MTCSRGSAIRISQKYFRLMQFVSIEMMGLIYKKARTVLVLLGKNKDVDANLAFDFMKSNYDSILLD